MVVVFKYLYEDKSNCTKIKIPCRNRGNFLTYLKFTLSQRQTPCKNKGLASRLLLLKDGQLTPSQSMIFFVTAKIIKSPDF
jgi:hypothetical protein